MDLSPLRDSQTIRPTFASSSRWLNSTAIGFVLFAIFILLFSPLHFNRSAVQAETMIGEVGAPALEILIEIPSAVVEEVALAHTYLETSVESDRVAWREQARLVDEKVAALAAITSRSDHQPLQDAVANLQEEIQIWRGQLQQTIEGNESIGDLDEQLAALLRHVQVIEREVHALIADQHAVLARVEQRRQQLFRGLAAFAFLAVLATLWIGRQQRQFRQLGERTEATLEQIARQWRLALDAANLGVWSHDLTTKRTYFDERSRTILGIEDAEMPVEGYVEQMIHPDDQETVSETFAQAIAPDSSGEYEYERRLLTADGTERWIQVRGQVQFANSDDGRRPTEIIGVILDVTEHKRVEEELRQSQIELQAFNKTLELQVAERTQSLQESNEALRAAKDLFFTAFHANPVAAGISRLSAGCILDVNVSFEELTGYSREEIIGKTAAPLGVWQNPEERGPFVKRLKQDGIVRDVAIKMRDRQGDVRTVLASAAIIQVEGEPCILGMFIDITDRIAAERALQRSKQALEEQADFLRSIFEGSGVAIFVVDVKEDGSVLYVSHNPLAEELTGLSTEEIRGKSPLDLVPAIPEAAARQIEANYQRCLARGEQLVFEEWLPTANGKGIWWFSRLTPLCDPEGRIYRIIATSIPIDERKEAEEKIRSLTKALTLAEQRERRRISQVLHDDLQQIIFGLDMRLHTLELELNGNQPASSQHLREHVHQSRALAQRAIRVSRTLSIELNPPVLKGEGLNAALSWLARHMSEQYDLRVHLDLHNEYKIHSEDRRVLLVQLVRELLFNVVKHAGVNEAHLRTYDTGEYLAIEVEDHGTGFDLAKLRSNHNQGDERLGLFSVEERLRLFGGHLRIVSDPNDGTTSTILLPLNQGIKEI